MAVSAETQAIIDELKNQGDLIRNSGTNSIKSMNIRFDRFDGLFKSINDNLIKQTGILEAQFNAAKQAAAQAETRRQYEELTPPTSASPTTPSSTEDFYTRKDREADEIGKKIQEAFSLKNIALAGAGLFLGYNFLKGAVDEATGGGWTDFEKGVGSFGKKLLDFDLPDFQTSLDTLNSNVALMATSFEGLTKQINETVEQLKSFGFWTNLAIGMLGPFTALTFAFKAYIKRLEFLEKNPPKPKGGFDDPPKLGYDPDAPRSQGGKKLLGFTEDGPVYEDDKPSKPMIMDPEGKPLIETRTPPKNARLTGGDDTPRIPGDPATPQSYSLDTKENRTKFRQMIGGMDSSKLDGIQYDPKANRLFRNTEGGGRTFVPDQQAEIALKNQLELKLRKMGGVEQKVYNILSKVLNSAGLARAFAVVDAVRILLILTDENKSVEQKRMELVSIVAGFFGAVAGAKLGAIVGTYFAGPWGFLGGGVLGAIAGAYAAEELTLLFLRAIFGDTPSDADKARAEEKMAERYGSRENYIASMEMRQMGDSGSRPTYNPTPDMETLYPRFSGEKSRDYKKRLREMRRLDQQFNRGNYYFGPGGQMMFAPSDGSFPYRVEKMSANGRISPSMIQQASLGGGGGNVIINAPQNVSPVVNNVEGGKSISHVQVANFGGGGGFGMGRDDPYNLSFV